MSFTTEEIPVGDLMARNPVVIESDAPATDAERLLKTYHVSGLPVVEGGVAVGAISRTDLMVARSSQMIGGNWPRMRVRHLMTTPTITVRAGTSAGPRGRPATSTGSSWSTTTKRRSVSSARWTCFGS